MKNIYYALTLTFGVILWMFLGQLSSQPVADEVSAEDTPHSQSDNSDLSKSPPTESTDINLKTNQHESIRVEVDIQDAQEISNKLEVSGHTEPNKTINLRAELSGKINAISVAEGQMVKKGQLVASLEIRDKQIQLQKALALQSERQNAFERTQKLVASKLQSKSSIEQALSLLKSAQAEVASVRLELERTKIYAPFSGLINQLDIEVGTFVEANTQIATLISIDPLIININIPQQAFSRVKLGQAAQVRIIQGSQHSGVVKYLSSLANKDTRSFKAKIEIENPHGNLPAGLSAKASIETDKKNAHFISPALLSLDSDGNLGIKTVSLDEIVEFHLIEIINSESKGLWVSGLPDPANIITTGQGYVREGTKVLTELRPLRRTSLPANQPLLPSKGLQLSAIEAK